MKPNERQAFEGLLKRAPKGTRIEFGVLRGSSLNLMAKHDGQTIGVDSFEGMGEHGERDIVGGMCKYPKGRLAVPYNTVRRSVPSKVKLIKGFVPEILAHVPAGPYAFAHLDMDQYEPTRAALEWIFPRMMRGGIVCCDDWFDGRNILASAAINEVALSTPLTGSAGRKAWWVV